MKPQSILGCFFAAYGIILAVDSLFAAAIAVSGIAMAASFSHRSDAGLMFLQSVVNFLPLVLGLVLAGASRRLGRMAARFAGITEETKWELHFTGRELACVLLATIGYYLIVTEASAVIRLLVLLFEARVGGMAIAETARARLPDGSQMITHALGLIGGVVLVRNCAALARVAMRETEGGRS